MTVGCLLEREGRDPATIEGSSRSRAGAPADAQEPTSTDTASVVRRAGVVAGALLAVGSVFGAAAVNDASFAGGLFDDDAPAGQGAEANAPGGGAVAIGPSAVADSLDPGSSTPQNWMPIAFPSALAGIPSGTGPAGGTAERPGGSGTLVDTPTTSSSAGVLPPVVDVVSPGGQATPSGLDHAATNLGGGAKHTAPLGDAVGGLTNGVADTVESLPSTLKGATKPVTDAVPAVKPVTELLLGSDPPSAPQPGDEEGPASSAGNGGVVSNLVGGLLGGH